MKKLSAEQIQTNWNTLMDVLIHILVMIEEIIY